MVESFKEIQFYLKLKIIFTKKENRWDNRNDTGELVAWWKSS